MAIVLDPRAKIAFTAAIFIGGLGASNWPGLGVTLLGLLLWCISARLPARQLLQAVSSLWILFFFTFVMHALFTPGTPLFTLGPVAITAAGLWRGAWMSVRLALLISGATVLTQTTSPLELTQALESVLSPLGRLGVPVSEAAMIVGISVRFLPVLAAETQRIQEAQMLRGHSVRQGSLIERVRSLVPILVPLMGGALRRAEELGDAMAARAYRPGARRTYLHPLRFQRMDYLLTAASLAAGVAVALWL